MSEKINCTCTDVIMKDVCVHCGWSAPNPPCEIHVGGCDGAPLDEQNTSYTHLLGRWGTDDLNIKFANNALTRTRSSPHKDHNRRK